MKKFIIQVEIKVNGEWKTFYHETISETKSLQVNNVYTENVTSDKKKAKVFYEKSEAQSVANMFTKEYQRSTVLPKK